MAGASSSATAQASCLLPGGTAGAPEPTAVGQNSGPLLPGGPAPGGLPARVDLTSATRARNRRWYFALDGGRLYVKPNVERTGHDGPWQGVSLPACLDGHLHEIAADDDELIATDEGRAIYTMDQALGTPDLFNWTSRWGLPFWLGPGYTVPGDAHAWAWSVVSPREDKTWIDPAGNPQTIGDGKVSHVWSLGSDGRRLTLNDPWLPLDRSYEMCSPYRARFTASSLAASGSTIFLMDRHGDLYTRLFDFDLSGLDNLFFRYSYEDQRGQPNPAIQLPPAQWIQHPKIPGRITDHISIEKIGTGAVHRVMRVEGLDAHGRTGFWQKDVTELGEGAWRFTATGAPLLGTPISNPPEDASALKLGPGEDARYVHDGPGWTAEIPDFHPSCDPDTLRVHFGPGHFVDLVLHVVDQIRTAPRARGLDDQPRTYTATIEVPATARADPEARAFVDRELGGRRFTTTDLSATRGAVGLGGPGWTFARRDAAPGETCVAGSGFDAMHVAPSGHGLALELATPTRSPATVEISRVASGDRVATSLVARLFRLGASSWGGPGASRRADGRYVVRVRTLTPGGRIDERLLAFDRQRGFFRALAPYATVPGCGLLRRLALDTPAFGGRSALPLRATLDVGEPARAVLVLRRGSRVVRALSLSGLVPTALRRLSISARGLPRGAYTLAATVTAADGRFVHAVVAAQRF
ncbi:MAG: hypothetical protein QOK04_2192 [Solirubrobacteraceae bacterium]|nr:hypothetical protein [Solirubrobacteraceae bacterium]